MADNVILNQPTTVGATIASDDIAGVQHQLVKVEFGADGAATQVSAADPLPVTAASLPLPTGAATAANQQTNALTDAQLRATAVPISGTVTATPSGTQNVDVTANTIGLATGAKQDTGNTSLGTIAGAVSGTEMQVDVLTMPTTTVQATDLDIRNIVAATDAISVHGDVGIIDQLDLTNSNPAAVAIVDGNGDQITSFGGGTQYTEDAPAAANPVGTAVNLIRQDTPAGLTTTDGDNVAQRGTNFGAGFVQVLTSAGAFVDTFGGGQQYADGVARGTATGTLAMGDDGTNIQSVKVDAAGELQVDVLTLPNVTIGAAIPAGNNNIGDVDIASIAAGDNNIGNVDVVTMPAITGTVTANAGTNLNTSALNLEATQADIRTSVQLLDDTVATDGVATPTKGILIAGQDGTNAQTVKTDADGNLQVDVLTMPSTVVTATDLDIRNLVFATDKIDASGTTLGANSGVDIGDVTINNAAGASAVNIQDGGNSITIDGTVTANLAAGTNNIGDVDILSTVDVAAITGSGSLTGSGQAVTLTLVGEAATTFQLTGTWVGTITFEASNDNSNWTTIFAMKAGDNIIAQTATTNDIYRCTTAGFGFVRARCSAYTSGTIAVSARSVVNTSGVFLNFPIPAGTNYMGNVRLTDGTLNSSLVDETGASAVDALAIGGGTPHDAVDSGNPVKVGGVAVSGSATPTSVAAGDRTRFIANQHGIPYQLGGHPNLIVREFDFGTAAQTDLQLSAAVVAADERCYVVGFEAMCDNANSVNVAVRAGFGTASVPTASATGVSGMIASHPGIAAGSGIILGNAAGIIAIGAAGEEPRLTSGAATSGNLHVVIRYFIIDETP